MRSSTREAREVGKLRQRQVHFPRRPAELEALDRCDEIGRQMLRADELHEGAPRIGAGDDEARAYLFTVLEHHTRRASVLDENPRNRRIGA
jgi:hypothetical protein